MAPRRPFPVVLAFLVVLSLFAARVVRADEGPCPELAPPGPDASMVRVEALEHVALGVVVAHDDLVAVPYDAVEVDKIGGPDAYVIDAGGHSVPASIVATDRQRRIALLRAREPVGTALHLGSADEKTARACTFVVGEGWELRETDFTRWSWVRFRAPARYTREWRDTRLPASGTPMVDLGGRLVGIAASDDQVVTAAEIEALISTPHLAGIPGTAGRRSIVGYGGFAISTFDVASGGGGWWGGRGSVAGRYRDLLEARLDFGLSFLLPKEREGHECGEPPCFAGARFALTPSLGLHLRLGSLERHLAVPIALKPSIGVASVFQGVTDHGRATAFDLGTPSAWWTLAPGLAVSLHHGEIGVRVRLPRAEVRVPTWEIAAGFVF